MYSTGQCPKDWKKLSLNSVSGCYHLFQEKKTWEDAEQECQNYDAHLISILSEDEHTMIYQVILIILFSIDIFIFTMKMTDASFIKNIIELQNIQV